MSPGSARRLFDRLRALDVRLWREEDRLRFSAPKGVMTPELKEELRGAKVELLDLLAAEEPAAPSAAASPLVASPRAELMPLSFAQRRLWFLQKLAPWSPAYNIPVSVPLRGAVDVEAMARSLALLTARHEVLRLRFVEDGDEPLQRVIAPAPGPAPLPVVDLGALPPEAGRERAEHLARREARRPFDLAAESVIRARLLRLDREEHRVLLTVHHVAADAWSMGLLTAELAAAYEALRAGREPDLPSLPVQYLDHAAWQHRAAAGEAMAEPLAWWRDHLGDAPRVLELPADHSRPPGFSDRGEELLTLLPLSLCDAVEAAARSWGATPFLVLLASFQAFLYRLSGRADLVLGVPVAGRERFEVARLVGPFLNTLAVRGDLAGDPSFRDLVERARGSWVEIQGRSEVPFELLVEELQPERSLSRSPLYQVLFQLQAEETARGVEEIAAAALARPVISEQPAKLDLEVALARHPAGLLVRWLYRADLFRASTMLRWVEGWRALLAAALEGPERRLGELPPMSAAGRHQILLEWNDAPLLAFGAPRAVPERIAARAAEAPDRVAVRSADAWLTFGELARRARALGERLRGAGVGPEVPVALAVERSEQLPAALLGIWRAGGFYVPLDPAYPEDRLALMLEDSGAPVLLTQSALLPSLPAFAGRVVLLDDFGLPGEPGAGPGHPVAGDPTPGDPTPGDRLAYVIYTSGSTGRPKGVEIHHRGLANFLESMAAAPGLGSGDRLVAVTSLSFDIAGLELYLPLAEGAQVIVASRDEAADGRRLADLAARADATVMQATPATWRLLLAAGWEGSPALSVLCGGEALPPDLAAELLGRAGSLWNLYGPTETTVWSSAARVTGTPGSGADVSLGRPTVRTSLHVVDRSARLAALGAAGELWIGGAGVARGYRGRPDLTADRFVPDPFPAPAGLPGEGARAYRTGDRARRRPDGLLEYLGRLDHQVKLRGFRIELGEIETALRRHPGVADAVAVVHAADAGAALVAYVVPEPGHDPPDAELREHLAESLPEHMLPGSWVRLAELPLTPNRKVDRKALPVPGEGGLRAVRHTAPRNAAEEVMAEIWREILGRRRVGVHDDFFAAGGHSLLAAQVLFRVARAFGVDLPVAALFRSPTVAALMEEVAAARGGETRPSVRPVPRDLPLPLTLQQERLWFLDSMDPGTSAFNLHISLPVDGPVRLAAFRRAVDRLTAHHEALRLRFYADSGRAFQEPTAPPVPLVTVDLGGLPEAARRAELGRLDASHLGLSFHLETGPLLAFAVVLLGRERRQLLLTMHHVITDGWSMGLIVRQLADLYEADLAGTTMELDPLPVQYPDYAAWQRELLDAGAFDGQIEYWRGQLEGLAPVLDLPADRPRPAVQTFEGASLKVHTRRGGLDLLRSVSRARGLSPFMSLLASWMSVLHRLSGGEDLCVGTYSAGRHRAELEEVVGFFVNTLPLRTDASGDPAFDELLERVRAVCLDAYTHQEVPFEAVVNELKPPRSTSYWPFFQVMMVYQDIPVLGEEFTAFTVPAESAHGFGRANYDLTLWLWESRGELWGMVDYSTNLFDRTTAARLGHGWLRLLEAALEQPERRLSELPLLSAAERHAVVLEWAGTDRGAPGTAEGLSLTGLFERRAASCPDATAVAWGTSRLSYGELLRRSDLLAARLRRLGVGPETAVGLVGERSPAMVVALLAVLRSGGYYLPLDPLHPAERHAFLVADAGARVVVAVGEHAAAWRGGETEVTALDPEGGLMREGADGGAAAPVSTPTASVHPGHPAYAIYTSGSTGTPKGVLVPRSALLNHTLSAMREYGVRPDDRVLQFASFTFDASAEEVFPAFLAGACLVLRDDRMIADFAAFAAAVERLAITVLDLPTAFWHGMVAALSRAGVDSGVSPAGRVRLVILGGEEASAEHVVTWNRLLGGRVRLVNSYGPTEATIVATRVDVGRSDDGGEPPWRVSIGRPIDGVVTRVLGRTFRPAPVGAAGELCLGGAGLARGYLGRPARTAASFVPDPLAASPGARLYRTGDLARFRGDGRLEFLGRRDRQLKVRGFRVEPGEVEARLTAHPGVAEALVDTLEETPGDVRLVAWLVPAGAGLPSAGELREHLSVSLPAYLLPAAFVSLDAFPRTVAGKVDRRALPAPEGDRPSLSKAFAAPATAIEERLAEVWRGVLRLDQVGRDDNFFELGGHSMLAVQVTARIREIFDVDLEVLAIFQTPTIALLAESVEEALLDLLEAMSEDEVEALL